MSKKDPSNKTTTLNRPVGNLGDQAAVPYVIVLGCPFAASIGQMYPLSRKETVMGRAHDVDIHVEDDGVSRRHGKIVQRGKGHVYVDLESRNGSMVNGERVTGERELLDGDKIELGEGTVLKYALQDSLDERYQRDLYEKSIRDPLTGIYNKRYFAEHLQRECAYAHRHARIVSLLLLDLDHFKRINDDHGHQGGDAVLREFSRHVLSSLRTEDVFARIGGEEFAIVLRDTPPAGARLLADRIVASTRNLKVSWKDVEIRFTVSIGMIVGEGEPLSEPFVLVQKADERLYRAKSLGRDRVEAD